MAPKKAIITGLLMLSMMVGDFLVFSANTNDAEAYFPLTVKSSWVYKAILSDNTVSTQVVLVLGQDNQYTRVGFLINQFPMAEIIYTRNENGIFRVKVITAKGTEICDPLQMVLPAKLNVGMSWGWEAADQKQRETAKVVGVEKVSVPAGSFDTIVVQYEGVLADGTQYLEKIWFAKGIGYVKAVENYSGKLSSTKELIEYNSAR